MNARQRSLIRKILYGAAIIPLCFVLIYIGRPGTSGSKDRKPTPGGVLSELRSDEGFNQSEWGEIDPAGEAIKLATFGMRGVAANLLWADAIEAKKKKDWTKLSATLNQVVKLQPNFLKVWEFQSWNLSYNCSAEFDDYRDRYRWVIQGIKFLQKGIEYNKFKPRLYQKVGWTISQKIGRADEKKQFRRIFIEDEEFHSDRPKSERDNWLVGREWYEKAADLIDNKGKVLRGDSPLIFRSKSPMCLMSYAESLERDGTFGEKARKAWTDADEAWVEYGRRDIPASDNTVVHLGALVLLQEQIKKMSDQLDALAPGVRDKLEKRKKENLTPQQREALDTPEANRSPKQMELAYEAEELARVSFDEVARNATGEDRKKATKLLGEMKKVWHKIGKTKIYRNIVNYKYWGLRAEVEQEDEMLNARRYAYEAQKAFKEGGNLQKASQDFQKSVAAWAEVLKSNQELIGDSGDNPDQAKDDTLMSDNLLMTDKATNDDINDLLEEYGKVLDQEDAMFPPDFPLAFYIRSQIEQNLKIHAIKAAEAKVKKALERKKWARAQEALDVAFNQWVGLIIDIPSLMQGSDPFTVARILGTVKMYAYILKQQDKPFPGTFALRQFVWTQVEHDPVTQIARGAYFSGQQLLLQKNYQEAEKQLKKSMDAWSKILAGYPSIAGDKTLCREMIRVVDAYRESIEAQNKKLPEKMPLQSILDRWGAKSNKLEAEVGPKLDAKPEPKIL